MSSTSTSITILPSADTCTLLRSRGYSLDCKYGVPVLATVSSTNNLLFAEILTDFKALSSIATKLTPVGFEVYQSTPLGKSKPLNIPVGRLSSTINSPFKSLYNFNKLYSSLLIPN